MKTIDIFENIGISHMSINGSDIADVVKGSYAIKIGIVESDKLVNAAERIVKKIPKSFKGDVALNVSSGKKLAFNEVVDTGEMIMGKLSKVENILWGATVSKELGRRYRVSIILADKDRKKWLTKWSKQLERQNEKARAEKGRKGR